MPPTFHPFEPWNCSILENRFVIGCIDASSFTRVLKYGVDCDGWRMSHCVQSVQSLHLLSTPRHFSFIGVDKWHKTAFILKGVVTFKDLSSFFRVLYVVVYRTEVAFSTVLIEYMLWCYIFPLHSRSIWFNFTCICWNFYTVLYCVGVWCSIDWYLLIRVSSIPDIVLLLY
jgi:hypothetical protein